MDEIAMMNMQMRLGECGVVLAEVHCTVHSLKWADQRDIAGYIDK